MSNLGSISDGRFGFYGNLVRASVNSVNNDEIDALLKELPKLISRAKQWRIGAIIQSDSGSNGGSRGASAKKLSTNGFVIKISIDGYIELYCKQQKVFVIK